MMNPLPAGNERRVLARRRYTSRLAAVACALGAVGVVDAAPVSGVRTVGTRYLRISYQVNASALPLDSVALWYTTDLGRTWDLFGDDADLRSPVPFEAPGEGLYGFYLVLGNQTGESSGNPAPGTRPQQQILVDTSPPLVQAHSASRRGEDDHQVFLIRWTAYDSHFEARPVTLEYTLEGEHVWRVIARNIANSEQYDWEVPAGMGGAATIRISVMDMAGNVSTAFFSPVAIDRVASSARSGAPPPRLGELAESEEEPARSIARGGGLLPQDRKERIAALLEQASWHQERGEWSVARQRLSEVLIEVPDQTKALRSLAQIDYRTGDYQNALRAWSDVLRQTGDDPEAWRGRALAEVALQEYDSAASSLERILEIRPGDGATMLSLGDVLLMRGERAQARRLWGQVQEGTWKEGELASKAAKRLRLYPSAGR